MVFKFFFKEETDSLNMICNGVNEWEMLLKHNLSHECGRLLYSYFYDKNIVDYEEFQFPAEIYNRIEYNV